MKNIISILILGGILLMAGCKSSGLPCPSYSQKDKASNAFQLGGSDVKYDRHGRVKK